jgi:hypothetical protein
MTRAFICSMLALASVSCAETSTPLPNTGRVYHESIQDGRIKFTPASGIEVIAQRINVCEKTSWSLGEASTTGIDSYVAKTDVDGYFYLPQKSFSNVCSYVILRGMVISPYTHSITSQVAKNAIVGNPVLYGSLGDSDVILKEAAKGRDRIQELSNNLNLATGSYTVSDTMRTEVLSRYFKEICELHKSFPRDSASLHDKATAILGNQCE